MATKTYAGVTVEVTDDGNMKESAKWTPEIAVAMAQEDGLTITDKHFAMLQYLRERVAKGETLTIRSVGKSGIVDIKGFYELFTGAPLRRACKYAGLPKPTSCV